MEMFEMAMDTTTKCSARLVTIMCLIAFMPANDAVQCYSCMSRTMGSLWEAAELDKIYMQQQSFTDHCQRPDEHRPAAFVRQCAFTCISMLIEVQFGMGARTQLRGCYDSIFRSGFNEQSPAAIRLKYKDYCQKFNLSEVIKQKLKYDSIVEICSCRGQFCNGGIMPTSGASGNIQNRNRNNSSTIINLLVAIFGGFGLVYYSRTRFRAPGSEFSRANFESESKMAPKQRMRVANEGFSKNVNSRGNIPKSLKPEESKYPAAPWLIGLFVFVVCGSAIFEVVRYVQSGF